MNLLPYYIKINKIIGRISRISNNLYRFIPIKLFFRIKTRKWITNYNKKKIKTILKKSLGDFSEYVNYCIDKEAIIELANNVIKHQFDILGSGPIILDPIDWHIDFKSGFQWPKGMFYRDYVQVDLTNNADVKIPRELSRSHHFLWLGQAYLLTKDEKYTREFISHVSHWIDENPVMRSINWGCTMDVAIRAVNWMYALNLFVDSELISEKFTKMITGSLYEHAWFIIKNLEKGFPYSNNHYMSDLVGLMFLGKLFNNTRHGKRWFYFALSEFYHEIRYQILPGGPSYECSISYHRLMTELVFYSFLLLRRNNINVPFDIRERIENMLKFILHYIKPDYLAPLIGDEDNGRLLPFIKYKITDHRYLLSLAAIEFKNEVYKRYSFGYVSEAFLFFGPESHLIFNSIGNSSKLLSSKNYLDAGFCIIRHEDHYLFINNSGVGGYPDHLLKTSSHTHADLLSFELTIGKTSFIIDPGTYIYSASSVERNKFRSTYMHNTLLIDEQNQHTLSEYNLCNFNNIAYPVEFVFTQTDSYIELCGAHDGYKKLFGSLIHQRIFRLDKRNLKITINDNISGIGIHNLKWFFHFNTNIDLQMLKNNTLKATDFANQQYIIITFNTAFHIKLDILDDFISASYGVKQKAKTLIISAIQECPCKLKTTIIKYNL